MAEHNLNLWAPWRAEYLRSLTAGEAPGPCFLCTYASSPAEDAAHHVICRADGCLVVMNRYPYTNGHVLVAPLAHQANIEDLSDELLQAMGRLTRLAVGMLGRVLRPDGYNVGMNLGRCAGAGLPGHLHTHIVPRWAGDTNFMTCVGDVRLIPESLDELYGRLRAAAEDGVEGHGPRAA